MKASPVKREFVTIKKAELFLTILFLAVSTLSLRFYTALCPLCWGLATAIGEDDT